MHADKLVHDQSTNNIIPDHLFRSQSPQLRRQLQLPQHTCIANSARV